MKPLVYTNQIEKTSIAFRSDEVGKNHTIMSIHAFNRDGHQVAHVTMNKMDMIALRDELNAALNDAQ